MELNDQEQQTESNVFQKCIGKKTMIWQFTIKLKLRTSATIFYLNIRAPFSLACPKHRALAGVTQKIIRFSDRELC